jgi:hypothetical protein
VLVKSSYYDQQVLTVLAEHLGSGGYSGPLYNPTMILIAANFQPTPQTKRADLTEATYSGYARLAGVVFGVPILQGDGSYQILSALQTFIAGAASNFVGNVIYGWALIDTAASPDLLMSEVFQTPIAFSNPNDGFGLVVQISEGALNPASQGNLIF